MQRHFISAGWASKTNSPKWRRSSTRTMRRRPRKGEDRSRRRYGLCLCVAECSRHSPPPPCAAVRQPDVRIQVHAAVPDADRGGLQRREKKKERKQIRGMAAKSLDVSNWTAQLLDGAQAKYSAHSACVFACTVSACRMPHATSLILGGANRFSATVENEVEEKLQKATVGLVTVWTRRAHACA